MLGCMGSLALEPGLALWRVGSTKRRAGGSLPGLQPPFYRREQVGDPCRGRGRTVSASLPPGGGGEGPQRRVGALISPLSLALNFLTEKWSHPTSAKGRWAGFTEAGKERARQRSSPHAHPHPHPHPRDPRASGQSPYRCLAASVTPHPGPARPPRPGARALSPLRPGRHPRGRLQGPPPLQKCAAFVWAGPRAGTLAG